LRRGRRCAERGFTVTATDVSAAALAHAARTAKERRVQVNFAEDDILASALNLAFAKIVNQSLLDALLCFKRVVVPIARCFSSAS
jgi:2-polyprenyl-3-methyl-5-hydroxy-6-metoxy-1,4-benzoquinol methylase